MDDMLKKILAEKELVKTLKEEGIKGYYIDVVPDGLLYRFVDMKGKWYNFTNLSSTGRKQLKID